VTPTQPQPTPAEVATATSYAQQAALAAHLQQLHLNAAANRNPNFAAASVAGDRQNATTTITASAPDASHAMDLMDADPIGWTIVDNERVCNYSFTI